MRALRKLKQGALCGSLAFALMDLSACGDRSLNFSVVEGIFRTKEIASPFFLPGDMEKDFFRYKDYVEAHSTTPPPGSPTPTYSKLDIAYDIYMVAQEVGIDPRVLLALVRKESSYRVDAESPTHAVGLTQFTASGIREVKDQLGARGTDYALANTIAYWGELVPRVYRYLSGGQEFTLPVEATSIETIKTQLKDDPLVAILYGAILLKTNLASIKEKNGPAATDTMRDIYRKALENYNGDPPVKEEYAKTIILWADDIP